MSATFDRGVVLDLATIDAGDISLANLAATCRTWTHHRATPADAVAERIAGAQVVVTNKVILDRARLAAARGLRLVCIAATGTNNVDLAAARELGIAVTNVAGYATPAVVQHVFAGILAHATRMAAYRASVAAGDWSRSGRFCLLDHPIHEIAGRRLGIVGYGELGRAVARIAEAFGMEVLIAQRPGGPPEAGRLPLAELLPRVHVLSLHCPLAENTRGLIGATELAAMRPDALLINTARGGIVDEAALAEALRRGHIGGAVVDVLSVEPPPPDHPLLAPDIPNLTVTPHVAWASREARQRLIDGVAAKIAAFAAGEPCSRVA
ncbi:lactate dehydrogenase-like oxidoreductase [Thioflavicoccus mobilis 8321]|uniref:Lactate dehydrogenase-like oxidoreductase n=1 Tax=Thioflavicoccus mobilis 8321 TaxID=765912 RepID=L0GV48_9GAMM|nr:2-hydroxyacid dehydrogenase [Thioflavicoccus mobilis]AGA89174.1 lactate dehydrogenase-like oxidoreductase [Thioflavicoccus mobilis 8321]